MSSDESTESDGPGRPGDQMAQLVASAKGWHTMQMAVLGFIGICGVLRGTSITTPSVIQVLAAILAVAALAVACVAIFTVARIAYPFGAAIDDSDGIHAVTQARSQLRTGIRLTVLALILIVTAALSGWWPKR